VVKGPELVRYVARLPFLSLREQQQSELMPVDQDQILHALKNHWGYDSLRPLQQPAMEAVLTAHDSVVVMPTGGGKSLCYQIPAVLLPGLAVVVSPLISLMKDQVDSLTECGIPAAAANSSLEPRERLRINEQVKSGELKLLYVAPERLCTERMLDYLEQANVSFIAIDEAHCISNWGHDFRPEYRMLGLLRERFPGIGIHAYTATATEQVRRDIAAQLKLKKPEFLVGNFDRPNLQYRVLRRERSGEQIKDVLARNAGESGIIYCISRKEVDSLTLALRSAGVKVVGYHAGLSDQERKKNQDAFLNDEADVVVATVAFGMGIDKPNVRFVLHTGAPKSLEHYQQETGRAGRDGLDSECTLLYTGGDFIIWRRMNQNLPADAYKLMDHQLRIMEQYCNSVTCRHRALVEHFGQTYEGENCGACDVCLDQQETIPDALIVGQKILSCVLRVNEKFGADYVAQVLMGSSEQRILENGHDRLSTYGLLKEHSKRAVREWIEQLSGQEFLAREGEYSVLKVTTTGRELLKGQRTPRLLVVAKTRAERKAAEGARPRKNFSVGMDAGLFESLGALRKNLAAEHNVPPYVVFGDVTLQDLARRRPTTLESFLRVHGVGINKAKQYGTPFLEEIARYCAEHGVSTNIAFADEPKEVTGLDVLAVKEKSAGQMAADGLFKQGKTIEEVMNALGRARSTVCGYLTEFLESEGQLSPEPWVDPETFDAVCTAAAQVVEAQRLGPIFEHLGGKVPYDAIRISLACRRNQLAMNTGETQHRTDYS
jgi:ATP-dependent DNA helicase RecQ